MTKEDWLVIMDIIRNLQRAIIGVRAGGYPQAELDRALTLAERAFTEAKS